MKQQTNKLITFSLSSQIQTELPTASVVQRNAVPKGFPEEATSTIAGILQIFRRRYDGAYAAPFLSTTVSALRTRVTQSDTHIAFLPFPLSPTDCGSGFLSRRLSRRACEMERRRRCTSLVCSIIAAPHQMAKQDCGCSTTNLSYTPLHVSRSVENRMDTQGTAKRPFSSSSSFAAPLIRAVSRSNLHVHNFHKKGSTRIIL